MVVCFVVLWVSCVVYLLPRVYSCSKATLLEKELIVGALALWLVLVASVASLFAEGFLTSSLILADSSLAIFELGARCRRFF